MSFNFMTAVTICSDSGAQENKVRHCFHYLPIYLPSSDGARCHDLSFLSVEFYASFFTLLFHLHQEALQFLAAYGHLYAFGHLFMSNRMLLHILSDWLLSLF